MTESQASAGASSDALQFDTAVHSSPVPAEMTCAGCARPLLSVYHSVNAKPVCSDCRVQLLNPPAGSVVRAVLLGTAAGFAGWCVYFAILKLTDYQLGIVAILVGYLVGRGVNKGSAGRGGRTYQVLAVLITYVAITASYLPLILTEMAKRGSVGAGGWIAAEIMALAYPMFAITESPIGLVILGFGLWQAWTLNQAVELSVQGPFTVAGAPTAESAIV
jgi:hypothetical protein